MQETFSVWISWCCQSILQTKSAPSIIQQLLLHNINTCKTKASNNDIIEQEHETFSGQFVVN